VSAHYTNETTVPWFIVLYGVKRYFI